MAAVTGATELTRLYQELSKGVANRIARPALMKAGRVAVKRVKATIPSRMKDARRIISLKSIKTKTNGGVAGVKVGAAVGMSKTKQKESKTRPQGKKGVGISGANIHWFFMGTASRETGWKTKRRRLKTGGSVVVSRIRNNNPIRFTGWMERQIDPVSKTVAAAGSEIAQIMRSGITTGIEKEAARMAKRRAK